MKPRRRVPRRGAPVPVVIVALAFLVGLAIGSFLNVVAHRLPRGESVVSPGSRCPACGNAIRPWHNVPVFGWLWLRGRCRDCGLPIPAARWRSQGWPG